jgi:hypothetical protein
MRAPLRIRRRIQATAVARAGWACVLLLVPDRVLKTGAQPPIPVAAIAVARVLGARELGQSAVTAVAPTGLVAGLGALVDALQAGTNVGIAAMAPRWRRTALIDALIAAGFAISGWSCRSRNSDVAAPAGEASPPARSPAAAPAAVSECGTLPRSRPNHHRPHAARRPAIHRPRHQRSRSYT